MSSEFDGEFAGKQTYLENEEVLLSFLENEMRASGLRTAILAGCYTIAYDPINGGMTPLIPEEHKGTAFEEPATRWGGTFPLKSLRLGLGLQKAVSPETKIVLLVNDHQQFLLFPKEYDKSKVGPVAEPRQRYFWGDSAIPRIYLTELQSHGLEPSRTLFEYSRERSNSSAIMPERSYLISEKFLLNRFEENTRAQLVGRPGFLEVPRPYGPPEIGFYLEDATAHAKYGCRLSSDGCGCTVIILELALMLERAGYEHLVILTPDECHLPVNASAQASIHGHVAMKQITVATGLGRSRGIGPFCRDIMVWQYRV